MFCGNFLPPEFDHKVKNINFDVIAQSCRNAVKVEVNELTITSGSLIKMLFSLMEVLLGDVFLAKNGVDV